MARTPGCTARQQSDQMSCAACAFTWDMNDPDPPQCLSKVSRDAASDVESFQLDPTPTPVQELLLPNDVNEENKRIVAAYLLRLLQRKIPDEYQDLVNTKDGADLALAVGLAFDWNGAPDRLPPKLAWFLIHTKFFDDQAIHFKDC